MKPGTLVAAGRTSDVYEFGPQAVVKVPRPEVPQVWAEIEADLTDAVHAFGLPAPAVLEVVTIEGRSCVVLERIHGVTMWNRMLEQPAEAASLTAELVAVQRSIHAAGLPDRIPDLVGRLSLKLAECDELPEAERTEAQELAELLPRGAALLHGDLHPGNVLLGPDGPVAIDWFDASIGHPLADVVRTSLLIRPGFPPADQRHLPGAEQPMLRAIHRAYVEHWGDLLSSTADDLRRWEAVVAAARVSERAHHDVAPLLSIWRDRSKPQPAALLEV